jgi:hypothetical protein
MSKGAVFLMVIPAVAAVSAISQTTSVSLASGSAIMISRMTAPVVLRKKCESSLSCLPLQAIIVMQTAENRFRDDSITDWQFVSIDRVWSTGLERLRNARP